MEVIDAPEPLSNPSPWQLVGPDFVSPAFNERPLCQSLDFSLRAALSALLVFAVPIASGMRLATAPLPTREARIPWQKLCWSVDGVRLGQTRQVVESELGRPARVFPKSGLTVLSYGKDFDPARLEFSTTTVGLSRAGRVSRISGQRLRLGNVRGQEGGWAQLETGLPASEALRRLGEPSQECCEPSYSDTCFYWKYRQDNLCLTLTFSSPTRVVSHFIVQRFGCSNS